MTALVRHPRFRRWGWIVIAALVLVSLGRATLETGPPRTTAEQVRVIGATLKCPTCRGQSVSGSDSAAAKAIRNEITQRVEAGESADEIRTAISATYDDVQLIPKASGFEGLVWIVPVFVLILGFAGVAAGVARWRRATTRHATEADRILVNKALDER